MKFEINTKVKFFLKVTRIHYPFSNSFSVLVGNCGIISYTYVSLADYHVLHKILHFSDNIQIKLYGMRVRWPTDPIKLESRSFIVKRIFPFFPPTKFDAWVSRCHGSQKNPDWINITKFNVKPQPAISCYLIILSFVF